MLSAVIILNFQDAVEESLTTLEEKYKSMSEICERPLFYDSPEVRQVLRDVKAARDSMHLVAYALTESFSAEDDEIEG